MAGKKLLLGIDLSTTAAKALLIDVHGEVISSASSPLELSTPRPLWSEQDPEAWWRATARSVRGALQEPSAEGAEILAVGLTGQMHGLVLLDRNGEILRPAILWNDQRTGAQCDQIRKVVGKQRLIEISGNDALPGFTAPKILWVRENEPDVYHQVAHILLPKDYIRYRLTGEYGMDRAGGAGTILFDLKSRTWSQELLERLEINPEWLPPTYEGTEITGRVSDQAAGETGLSAGISVVGGGGDQAAQAVGVGAISPGVIALTMGTSGVVFASTENPLIEPQGRLHAFCHSVPGRWHLMGVMLSAAGSLQWHRDQLAPDMAFDELVMEADDVPAGSEGLVFLPYLSGERTPYPDPLARASWVGLTMRHERGHMTRALLEGVAFGLKDSFRLIRNAGLGEIHQVRVSGGGAKSELWRQILADILETELVTVNTTEGAAYGAAMLAAVGAGLFESVDQACQEFIKITGRTQPSVENEPIYQSLYQVYNDLYPTLSPTFKRLSEISGDAAS